MREILRLEGDLLESFIRVSLLVYEFDKPNALFECLYG